MQDIPQAPTFTPEQLGRTCLVTGGAGYVGSAIVRRLVDAGCEVRSLDVLDHKAPEGVTVIRADLRKIDAVRAACEGVDTVFHAAAIINLLSHYRPALRRLVYDVNCVGTQNVLRAAAEAGVKTLVQTSTFNVVLDGQLDNADESTPYVADPRDLYSMTKIEAERMVLAADTPGGLRTAALRPGGIWGPDVHSVMIKSFLTELARGNFKVLIGDGRATMDNTHIDNLVDAQLLAAKALRETPDTIGGQAYFITDDEPVNGLVWFQPIVEGLGERFPNFRLPGSMMRGVSRAMELVGMMAGKEPGLTWRGMRNLTESSSFSIAKARRDLGYSPRYQRANGVPELLPAARRFVESLRSTA